MKEKQRWGPEKKHVCNWKEYNEELVVRGEFFLELEWVKSWDSELEKMNGGKRGKPFVFPESLIRLQGLWHQWMDYREIEGLTRKLAELGLVPEFNDYSTVNRRVNKLDIELKLPEKGFVSVTSDGTGIKMTNRGEYKTSMYGGRHKKYVHVTITVNTETKKILASTACVVGEGDSEPETAQKHMRKLIGSGTKVKKFLGNGSFDTRKIFNFCEENKIETAVKNYKVKEYKKWAKETNYGKRWVVEGVFSAVKRKFTENTRSKKNRNIIHEIRMKFWAHQSMKDYAEAKIRT